MTDDRFRLSPNAVPQDEWSDMNRDLGVAVGVFAACVFILAVAFNEPDTKPIEDGGESIAINNNIPDAGTMDDEVPGVNDDFNFSDESESGTGGIVVDDDTAVDTTDTGMPGLDEHLDVPDDTTPDDTSDSGTIVVDSNDSETDSGEFDFNVPDNTDDDEDMGEIIVVSESTTSPDDSATSSTDSQQQRAPIRHRRGSTAHRGAWRSIRNDFTAILRFDSLLEINSRREQRVSRRVAGRSAHYHSSVAGR